MSGCHCTLLYLPIISPHFSLYSGEEASRKERAYKAERVRVSKPQSVCHSAGPSSCQLVTTATVIISSNLKTLHAFFLCLHNFHRHSVPNYKVCTKIGKRRFFKRHRLEVVVVVGCFASLNYLSGTIQLLGILIFPFVLLLGAGAITTVI